MIDDKRERLGVRIAVDGFGEARNELGREVFGKWALQGDPASERVTSLLKKEFFCRSSSCGP